MSLIDSFSVGRVERVTEQPVKYLARNEYNEKKCTIQFTKANVFLVICSKDVYGTWRLFSHFSLQLSTRTAP